MAAFTHVSEDIQLGLEDGLDVLTPHALSTLVAVAGTYGAVVTYTELSLKVQQLSGLTTTMGVQNWIGKLLGRVVRDAHRDGLPPLTALVVRAHDGMVGDGYAEVLAVAGEIGLNDSLAREEHAAISRLRCYRHFGAPMPEDAPPLLSPKLAAAILSRRQREARPVVAVCASCFMELPANGVCSCS